MLVLTPRTLGLAAACLWSLAATTPTPSQQRTALRADWTFAPGAAATRPNADAYRSIAVPGTFEDHLGATFDGSGWYRRTLDLAAARGQRVRVEFTAAATEASVFFNGQGVGTHLGGWTPFRVELLAARGDGTDLLEVFLDEKVGHNTQGFHPIIQPHFGGLWQDVVLCVDAAPTLDRFSLLTFGDGAHSVLKVSARALPGPNDAPGLHVAARVFDGAREIAHGTQAITADGATFDVAVPTPRAWSPRAPHLYRVQIELRAGDIVLDQIERRVGFRDLRADEHRLLLNGEPLSVRGMLHWGYEPPLFAPNPDPAVWRHEMEDLRARGFNMVKACLWVPPHSFFDMADELGLLVWQEYPTWHPDLTPANRDALLREFDEFFLHDRSHVCAPFRSLTCETGHAADLTVIQALYDRAKATIPQALVVDDSSWIEWLRVFDFYDDHPYGNNSWWPGKLAALRKFIAQRQAKPLLLGECIAADTWFDRAAWERAHGTQAQWFAPRCLPDQPRFEAWLEREFGAETLHRLLPSSLAYAMRMRQYQIERLRLDLPAAGYTVSVLRDFTLARMGFYDDLGAMKWPASDWSWHGDTMLCLDTKDNARAFVGSDLLLPVRVAHAGAGACRGRLRLHVQGVDLDHHAEVSVAAGVVSDAITLAGTMTATAPQRLRVHAELTGSHGARSAWDVWHLPASPPVDTTAVRIVDALSADTLTFLRGGGRVLLRAGERARSLKTDGMWFLRGACFAPPHPVHARVPAPLLEDLQTFDLETGRVLLWNNLQGQVDPILAFWETHDIAEVRAHLFAFDTRVGEGRLLATILNHDTPAGLWVLDEFKRHLMHGAAPTRALSDATLAALTAFLDQDVMPLPTWDLLTDPRDEGVAKGYAQGNAPTDGWLAVHTKSHWEAQGVAHYDGVAWYRCQVEIPAAWQGKTVTAVFEGVDDSFRLYVNGAEIARFGDPEKDETVWLQRVTADLSRALRPGQPNAIVLRVVDHRGAGGVYKPVFLTTGPADAKSDLLH